MRKSSDLTAIFGKFSGKTLKNPDRLTCDIDQTMYALEETAALNGLTLRVLFPGRPFTKDLRDDRVNIHVTEEANGAFRISSNFTIG